ncbi:MAG: hypothetical protein ACREBV_02445 [Candidatus Zixiibacteriota bacterium]
MLRFWFGIIVSTVFTLICLSCVQIKTGQTVDEAIESNEVRAKEMRVEWAQRLKSAEGDADRAQLVKSQIDSISAMIVRYGFKIADEWHKGNEGRGQDIDASEMRNVVNCWVAAQKPFLNAHEDNMEYGIRLIHETRRYNQFSEEAYDLLDSLVLQYYDTYSIVFYPNQDVDSFEEILRSSENKHRSISERLGALLR